MTKELVLLTLAALTDQIERDEILIESVESTMNDEAGHITLHWLKLPRPESNKDSDWTHR